MAEFLFPVASTNEVVLKAEAVAGTDIFAGTYVAADVQPVDYRSIRATLDANEIENLITMGSRGRAPSLKGPRLGRVSFRMPWRGSASLAEYDDTPLVAPESHRALLGCGLLATFANPGVGSSKITYTPSDTDLVNTLYCVYKIPGGNALSSQFVGCVGTFSVSGEASGPVFFDFDYVGAYEGQFDIPFVAGTLVGSPTYPQLVSAAFQIGSANYAAKVRSFRFVQGNRFSPRRHINAATGIEGYKTVDRRPLLSVVVEMDRDANSGWEAAMSLGTLLDCTFQLGTVSKNRLKFQFGADGATPTLEVVALQHDVVEDVPVLNIDLLPTIAGGANTDWAIVAD